MQRVIVVYDIVEDKTRTKVADACKDYGLDRAQYSVFVGRLSRNHQEELMMTIDDLLFESHGNVTLIPIGEREWRNLLEVDYA